MKIGLNWLVESENLINEGIIEVDFIKYPSIISTRIDDLKKIKNSNKKDILFHGLITNDNSVPDILSSDFTKNINIPLTKESINITNTPSLSIHLGEDFSVKNNIKILKEKEILNILKFNYDYLKEKFNIEKILLENREISINKIYIDPLFITKACEYVNSYFLLDISHAIIAANILNMNIYDYINKLPLNRLYEIHINGVKYFDKEVISHIKCDNIEYEILEYLVKKTNVEIVTLEYGNLKNKYNLPFVELNKDKQIIRDEIIEQINKIKQICNVN
jgi:uncharacterized protein